LRANYAYFPPSGLLLRLGRYIAPLDASLITGPRKAKIRWRHAESIHNLAKLIIIDAAPRTLTYHDTGYTRSVNTCISTWAGTPRDYFVLTGRIDKNSRTVKSATGAQEKEEEEDEEGEQEEDSDTYIAMSNIIPNILDKAFLAERRRRVSLSPDGWKAGGMVRRTAGSNNTIIENDSEVLNTAGGKIICVFDLVACGTAFKNLRYVNDARQMPFNGLGVNTFERRFCFPVAISWEMRRKRVNVEGFTRGVYS